MAKCINRYLTKGPASRETGPGLMLFCGEVFPGSFTAYNKEKSGISMVPQRYIKLF